MADRMSYHPMFSQNIMQTPVQQQAQQQMLQQSQQPQQPADPQMMQSLSNPEAGRMWQQMQNQQSQMQAQMQNSYRPLPSGDLTAPQMNQQDYARGQAYSQGQGQQALAQQQQQPFGLNAQRFNPPGATFHDSQGNQAQPFIPSNFLNMPANTPQMKSPFVRGQVIQAPINNPNVSRQLQFMASQNQQAPNGVDMARLQQTGFGIQPAAQQATDVFVMSPNPDQMHGSPHSSAHRMVSLPNTQAQVQNGQRLTLGDCMERYQLLRNGIPRVEQKISEAEAAIRAGNIPEPASSRLAAMRMELNTKRHQFQMLNAYLSQVAAQQKHNGTMPANMSHLNLNGPSLAQPPQQAPGSVAPQQSFPAQVNSTSSQGFSMTPPRNGTSPLPAVPQNSAGVPQQISAQPGQMNRPNTFPARSVPGSHQLPSQATNSIPPNVANANQFGVRPANGQGVVQSQRVKPLDAQRFESTYAQFCRSQRMTPNMKVTIAENRVVDLHRLHAEVLQEGGYMSVTLREWWSVIGGRMGWIQFPGDPPRCGPGIAQQLQHTYKEHLSQFESAYIMTVRNRSMTQQQQPQQQQQPANGMTAANGRQSAVAMPTETQPNLPFDPRILQYANLSAADLRARGMPQATVDMIEVYRPQLAQWRQAELTRRAAAEKQTMANSQIQVPSGPEPPVAGGAQRPPQLMPVSVGDHKPDGQFPSVPSSSFNSPMPPESARAYLAKLQNVIILRGLDTMQPQVVTDDQRPEYDQLLERACKLVDDLDNKLPEYWNIINHDETIRRFAVIIVTVRRQRELLSTSSQFVINFTTLRNMVDQTQRLIEECEQRRRLINARVANTSGPSNPPPPASVNRPAPAGPPPTVPQPTSAPMTTNSPAPLHPSPLPQQPPQPPVTKKPAQPSPSPPNPPAHITNTTSPTPPPSVSTPATSAATPQAQPAGSPQNPKSPKSKVALRPKVPPRVRKPSTSTKGAATPDVAPTPVVGVKRPPQDDTAAILNPAPSEPGPSQAPSPKKIRTEWEGEPSEALLKRQQQIKNVKTEEDTIAFFDQMRELLAISARADSSVHNDIAASLSEILAGVSQEPEDAAATAAALSTAREFGQPPTALSPHQGPVIDAFGEFFDFSSYNTLEDEESDSKAPTPELVPSSETNPSPESGSDADASAGSPGKTKIEDSSDHIDLLRLGVLREIDGGEAAHYQSDHWKWEGTMPTSEQPWAMLTS
ncbi:hypothetical protein F5J12DRAFT_810324 [Pisolithus orientalis]|uniref:uncharacterized protein n=1 Tax=Pisolithus orientalis TaxID=936130 RepID=UPI002225AF71|nr:uncharacterized protein F5J12DRAFT_810324 [Pisolithus orientalis]KAI6025775.1 hypothetical protein F5J12DRAFT_810324 [Pisolithus orientalis]